MKTKLALLLLASLSLTAQASNLNLGINDDVISTDLQMELNPSANLVMGYLYSNDEGHMVSAAAHMTHDAGGHHFEVGPKFSHYWAKNSSNGSVVAIGGRYSLDLGSNIALKTSAYYAPSVLSFGSVDGQYELDGKIQFQVNPNLGLFAGYRNIRLQYDDSRDNTFDSGFYIGASANF
ncbi:YfaZ family outer membrane protein [Shewanella sp. Isolate8]|uniref:YfaZ family outer membrane protein n=1 Tax=Shewanella sp. Isolate8 TaxID=2908529 RepID=UPI001EFE09A9|nr:YfaZ family outer membrane protein [Shewanella sp. Isolate8]MCG9747257.1 YfaZ family protein [Shewanella sp. Isolate8]